MLTKPFSIALALSIAAIACAQQQTVTPQQAEAPGQSKTVSQQTANQQTALAEDGYDDIGQIHQDVSTQSQSAQRWFDRGLAMCYGFNHEEAVRCFEKSLQEDPSLAMAHWGIAYAWGPNINNMETVPHQIAKAEHAIRLASLLSREASPMERDLIAATATRYATPVPQDRTPLNQAYADAMRKVYEKYGETVPMIATLFAESLMNLQPWQHWSADGKPGKHTAEITGTLERGMQRWPTDPALCHLYIHTIEASPHPERALPAANALRNAVPGSGHLVHMPTHIDVLLGNYADVIECNQRAIAIDDKFMQREGPYNFYSLYRIHNYHFLVYGAMFDGQRELAVRAARALVKQVPEEMVKEQVDFLDAFMPTPLHVMIRFGQWDEILQEPEPADFLPVSQSIWHYARALAYAATGRIEEAEDEQSAFAEVSDTVPDTSFLFQNASQHILGVAEAMIAGEIAYRKGDFENAFESLREAVRRDDALNYDEPWGWMQPTRHALGALLLERGRFAESEAVYRADLQRHPKNPWSLSGLAEALEKQGKGDEAAKCRAEFETASQRTDVKIDRSCYCRLNKE